MLRYSRCGTRRREAVLADVIELARQHDDAFNAHDAAGRRAIEAPEIELVMPGGMTLRGHESVMQVVSAFWEALPDGRIKPDDLLAAGDVVIAEGSLVGTHTGPFRAPNGEIPPTGNAVALRYAAIKRFRDGRLVSEHLYFDQLEFLQQLGVAP
jgi:predicted ester cyclase